MEAPLVPAQKIEARMPQEAVELKTKAPDYFVDLIEDCVLNVSDIDDLLPGQVSALDGGESSACYLLQNDNEPLVIKFRRHGVDAEKEVTTAWQAQGVRMPEIKNSGTVPMTKDTKTPVKYLLQEAILDSEGKPAKTGWDYLSTHPDSLERLGQIMGQELARLHKAKAGNKFGGIGDMWDKDHQVDSFSQYLIDRLNYRKNLLVEHGFGIEPNTAVVRQKDVHITEDMIQKYSIKKKLSSQELLEQYRKGTMSRSVTLDIVATHANINSLIQQLNEAIDQITFPQESTYVHGDFGLHNTLIESEEPVQVRVFDPNPLKADYYWDLAHQKSRLDRKWVQHQQDPNNDRLKQSYDREKKYYEALIQAYIAKSGETIDSRRLLANQLAQTMNSLWYESKKTGQHHPEVKIRQLMLHRQMQELIQPQITTLETP